MDKINTETLPKLKIAIKELDTEADCSIQRIDIVIHIILECFSDIEKYV